MSEEILKKQNAMIDKALDDAFNQKLDQESYDILREVCEFAKISHEDLKPTWRKIDHSTEIPDFPVLLRAKNGYVFKGCSDIDWDVSEYWFPMPELPAYVTDIQNSGHNFVTVGCTDHTYCTKCGEEDHVITALNLPCSLDSIPTNLDIEDALKNLYRRMLDG